MSELDLTAAVEAAAEHGLDWIPADDGIYRCHSEGCRFTADNPKAADYGSVAHVIQIAAPLIEAAVREQVAREIEAERDRVGSAPHRYAQAAMTHVASIARGQRAREREAFSGLLEAEGDEDT